MQCDPHASMWVLITLIPLSDSATMGVTHSVHYCIVAVYRLDLVTRAEKDEGTIELCSIATLMKIISAFYKLLFTESIWSEKACRVLHVKVTY
jgi:hypothetical protein